MADNSQSQGFEKHIERYLQKIPQVDGLNAATDSRKRVDFKAWFEGRPACHLEIKEKKQPYNTKNWPKIKKSGIPEEDAFIVDEVSLRRLLSHGMYSWILARDRPGGRLITFNFHDLIHMPRYRVDRKNRSHHKGKWVLSFQWGDIHRSLHKALSTIYSSFRDVERIAGRTSEFPPVHCYEEFGREVPEQGVERTEEWKQKDVGEK